MTRSGRESTTASSVRGGARIRASTVPRCRLCCHAVLSLLPRGAGLCCLCCLCSTLCRPRGRGGVRSHPWGRPRTRCRVDRTCAEGERREARSPDCKWMPNNNRGIIWGRVRSRPWTPPDALCRVDVGPALTESAERRGPDCKRMSNNNRGIIRGRPEDLAAGNKPREEGSADRMKKIHASLGPLESREEQEESRGTAGAVVRV